MFKLCLLAALVALAAASAIPTRGEKHVADKEYLMKEKAMLQLFSHIQQPLIHPHLIEIAQKYNIEEHMEMYKEKEPVMHFMKLWKEDLLLKKGEIFTPFSDEHLEQALYLFDMFYFAKDWDTMYKTAVWARQNVNEGLFAYAWMTALRNHPATHTLVLPRLYEIFPHMFIRSEVIQQAYDTRMRTTDKDDKDIVVIPSNFSSWLDHKMTPEKRIAYFTEDVSYNEWVMERHLNWPWWMEAKSKRYGGEKPRYGERIYFQQKQLLARYRWERIANNLADMEIFKWNDHKMVGYAPHLRYKNGQEMPMRPDHMELVDTEEIDIDTVKRMEDRVQLAIDMGFIKVEGGRVVPINTEAGLEVVSRIIDQTQQGVKTGRYGSLLRKLFVLVGRIMDPKAAHGTAPSALMQWETQHRDPMYYSIVARVHELFRKYKALLSPYKKEDLLLPGVKIESLEFEKLVTYFESFDVDISNAMDIPSWEEEKKISIMARQSRLNFKPYTFHAMINSETPMNVNIRLFLAPKFDSNGLEMSLKEQAQLMVEVERFPFELVAGKNKIVRSAKDFIRYEEDKLSFKSLSKKIEDAIQGKAPFYIDEDMQSSNFPAHLMLPKGKKNGMAYNFYMMVSPVKEQSKVDPLMFDNLPLGYPFDREIHMEEFHIPNFYQKEVLIFHKKTDETHESI